MDIKTLFVFISISAICVLGLSIHVYLKHTRFIKGSIYWLGAILAISGASIAFGLITPMPWYLHIRIANTLLMLCPILMSISFRLLYNRGKLWLPIVSFLVAATIFNLTVPESSVNDRIIVFSILFGLLWFDPIFLTLQKPHRKHALLLGLAFLFASVCSFLRVIGTLLHEGQLNSLLEGGVIQQVYVIAMGLELFLFLAGYILMLNSRNLERISSNEATFRAAIDNSPYSMIVTDQSGNVVSTNATFERLTGYPLSEIRQGGLTLLQTEETDKDFAEQIWTTLRAEKSWDGQVLNKRKDGTKFWERAVWSPIKTDEGKVTGFFGVTQDVTHSKQLEDFKDEVEHIMRHDLKTPLNAIINLPDIIQMEGGLTAEQQEFLDIIRESGNNMLEQINNSLELYKLEEHTYQARYEPVDLRLIIDSFEKVFLPLARTQDVTLKSSFRSENMENLDKSFTVQTDRHLLNRLIGNLLKNAIEASPSKGIVQAKVVLTPDAITLSIHNSGAIPTQIRARFFAKFNTFGKFNGTGLGAYGSKLIADFLGYSLSFTTSEEIGTTLFLRIPSR